METLQKAAKARCQSSLFMKKVLVLSAEVSFMPVGGAAADFLTKYLKFFFKCFSYSTYPHCRQLRISPSDSIFPGPVKESVTILGPPAEGGANSESATTQN